MSAEAYREEEMYSEVEPNIVNIKRNPYLVDYEQRRRQRGYREQEMAQSQRMQRTQRTSQRVQEEVWEQEVRRAPQRRPQQGQEMRRAPQAASTSMALQYYHVNMMLFVGHLSKAIIGSATMGNGATMERTIKKFSHVNMIMLIAMGDL